MPSDQRVGDELLESGGWSRRTGLGIGIAVVVLAIGLVIGLTRSDHQTTPARSFAVPSPAETLTSSSPPALTGNDVLSAGVWATVREIVAPNHTWIVIASAELVSGKQGTFAVLYPIAVTASGIGTAVFVTDAVLSADHSNRSLLPPKPLTTIRGARHLEVWMKLRITCDERKFLFRNATVSIALNETTVPAVFRLADLFGSSATRPMPC